MSRRWFVVIAFAIGCGNPSSRAPVETPAPQIATVTPDAAPPVDASPPVEAPPDPTPTKPNTTVTHFELVRDTPWPSIPAVGAFAKLGTPRVVRIAINTWAGWGPLLWANQGAKPNKVWKDGKGGDFQVELVVVDDPLAMRDQFAAGTIHAGWATVDMLPLLIDSGLGKDPRTLPRVFQQIDWSHGGDGIVVRDTITKVADLRGKTIVLAQRSASHYLLLRLLRDAGLDPTDVTLRFVKDPFQAAAAFDTDATFAAAVTWAPDIEALATPGSGNRVLVDTKLADHAIAGVWFARADFAKANGPIIEGLVRGVLDAVADLESGSQAKAIGGFLDTVFGLPTGIGQTMLGDVHWANAAENRLFFDPKHPVGFAQTFASASALYKTTATAPNKIADGAIVNRLMRDPRYAGSSDTYGARVAAKTAKTAVLTLRVAINFYPNSFEVRKMVEGRNGEMLYDPNVDVTIETAGGFAMRYGGATIEIAGHTDASMRNVADEALVRQLSLQRATAVRDELVQRFRLSASRFTVVGRGWDVPADPADPDNHVKNRRIEFGAVP